MSPSDISDLTEHILNVLAAVGLGCGSRVGPFVHGIRSELLVYGCQEGEFFEETFDEYDAYERRLAEVQMQIVPARRRRHRVYLDALLASRGRPTPRRH